MHDNRTDFVFILGNFNDLINCKEVLDYQIAFIDENNYPVLIIVENEKCLIDLYEILGIDKIELENIFIDENKKIIGPLPIFQNFLKNVDLKKIEIISQAWSQKAYVSIEINSFDIFGSLNEIKRYLNQSKDNTNELYLWINKTKNF